MSVSAIQPAASDSTTTFSIKGREWYWLEGKNIVSWEMAQYQSDGDGFQHQQGPCVHRTSFFFPTYSDSLGEMRINALHMANPPQVLTE